MWNERLPRQSWLWWTLHPLPAPGMTRHQDRCLSRASPQWAQSPGQSAAFSLMSSPPPVKGLLPAASFEVRIRLDREGQGSSDTCSNDRQVFQLCPLSCKRGAAEGVALSVLWLLKRTKWQRAMPASFLQGPPCRWQMWACPFCTHAKLRLAFRSLLVGGSWVRLHLSTFSGPGASYQGFTDRITNYVF